MGCVYSLWKLLLEGKTLQNVILTSILLLCGEGINITAFSSILGNMLQSPHCLSPFSWEVSPCIKLFCIVFCLTCLQSFFIKGEGRICCSKVSPQIRLVHLVVFCCFWFCVCFGFFRGFFVFILVFCVFFFSSTLLLWIVAVSYIICPSSLLLRKNLGVQDGSWSQHQETSNSLFFYVVLISVTPQFLTGSLYFLCLRAVLLDV